MPTKEPVFISQRILPWYWFVYVIFVALISLIIATNEISKHSFILAVFTIFVIILDTVENFFKRSVFVKEEGVEKYSYFGTKIAKWSEFRGSSWAPKGIYLTWQNKEKMERIYIPFKSYKDPEDLLRFIHKKFPETRTILPIEDLKSILWFLEQLLEL